jgi:hypothetical protein
MKIEHTDNGFKFNIKTKKSPLRIGAGTFSCKPCKSMALVEALVIFASTLIKREMKRLFCAMIGLTLLLTSCTNLRKYENYRSKDSLYCIDVPVEYKLEMEEKNVVAWSKETDHICVRRNFARGTSDFKLFADNNVQGLPARFTVDLKNDSNDSILHYAVHTGYFYQDDIYFFKRGASSTYIIEVTGEGVETAKRIAASLKELKAAKKTEVGVEKSAAAGSGKSTYEKEGFAIGKEYDLQVYKEYIEQMKKLDVAGKPKLIGAYYCLQNKESPETATLINVNVFDLTGQQVKGRLNAYIGQLQSAGIENRPVTFEHCDAVEYSFEQDMGTGTVPTKALYVIKDNKYYLIQLSAQNDVDSKFDKLLKSFTFIK